MRTKTRLVVVRSLVLAGLCLAGLAMAETRVFRLRHQGAATVCSQLLKGLGADAAATQVAVDGLKNSLTVTAPAGLLRQVEEVISRLDAPVKAVAVELLMVEFPPDSATVPSLLAGLRSVSTVSAGSSGVLAGGAAQSVATATGEEVAELWEQLTSGTVEAEVLAAPKVMAADGEEATLSLGSQVHYMVPIGRGLYRLKTLEGSGSRFRVTSEIRADGIHVSLNCQVQRVTGRLPLPEAPDLDVGIPTVSGSGITTTVTVRDGETVLAGGWDTGDGGGRTGAVLLRVSTVDPATGGRTRLEFRLAAHEAGEGLTPATVTGTGDVVYLHEGVELSTDDVASTRVVEGIGGRPSVEVQFTGDGAKRFAELTRENVGRAFAIMVDGQVVSAPIIRDEIRGGRALITGNFTLEEAKRIAEGLSAE